jgi:crotonobetainyl-CoA:carnitine CoA-transferase CaiB-like acyl-CoA transferase
MMGGLAYMTGPVGRPLRAGSSVNDIMGGMFGAIGALAALYRRERDGRGETVQSALFENNVFLVAQHMMQYAVTGQPAAPMPSRISAWGVYDVFALAGGEQIFLAVVSDTQWAIFCDAFAFADLRADPRLASNNLRVLAREADSRAAAFNRRGAAEVAALFERHGRRSRRSRAPRTCSTTCTCRHRRSGLTLPADASVAEKLAHARAAAAAGDRRRARRCASLAGAWRAHTRAARRTGPTRPDRRAAGGRGGRRLDPPGRPEG